LEELLQNNIPLLEKLSKSGTCRTCEKEDKINQLNVEGCECG
jgi:hypothetical protein